MIKLIRSLPGILVCLLLLTVCQPVTTNTKTETTQEPMTPTPEISTFVIRPASSLPLDGDWRFAVDAKQKGEAQAWFAPEYDDSAWQTVSVPHTWNVMPKFSQYNGLAWYRARFTLPKNMEAMHLRLRFQAVFYLAQVWINGVPVGEHEGGYTPFEFDVSSLLKPGQENVIAVRVDNKINSVRIPAELRAGWSYDWWNYGGIVRSVSLEATNPVYLSGQQIVAVPHLTGPDQADSAEVTSSVILENVSANLFEGLVSFKVLDEGNREVVFDSGSGDAVSLAPGQPFSLKLSATLSNPRLWHFDHPNLYLLVVSLEKVGQEVHRLESIFGIRTVELKGGQMLLNGEPVRLVGVTRHADSPQFGLAESVQIMAADYEDIKTLNEVLSRPVHYPQAEFILDYADRHGILLIPEIPAWQLSAQQMALPKMQALEKLQLREMITTQSNHPAIWAWSIGNEIESETPSGHAFVKEMVAYVKTLDPTRPVVFASNRLYTNPDQDATAYSDFVMMNQYWGGWGGPKQNLSASLDAIHAAWPEKTVIISEFGFEPNWNRLWGPATSTLTAAEYYFIPDGIPTDGELADEQRRLLIREQMAVFRTKPFVAGAVFWTYQDYRTRSKFVMGVVDPERKKRPSWEVLREEFSPILIDSLTLSPLEDGKRTVIIRLRTRGPVETDLPAYTLRGYKLHWRLTSPDGVTELSAGELDLPTLAPAAAWSGKIQLIAPDADFVLTISFVRPTGYTVIERSYNARGEILP